MRIRHVVVSALIACAAAVAVPSTASAAPLPEPIGPECHPSVVTAVLDRLAELGVAVTPGQRIQYLEVFDGPNGVPSIRPCVVTVPSL